jgi:hypothetical protein
MPINSGYKLARLRPLLAKLYLLRLVISFVLQWHPLWHVLLLQLIPLWLALIARNLCWKELYYLPSMTSMYLHNILI